MTTALRFATPKEQFALNTAVIGKLVTHPCFKMDNETDPC